MTWTVVQIDNVEKNQFAQGDLPQSDYREFVTRV